MIRKIWYSSGFGWKAGILWLLSGTANLALQSSALSAWLKAQVMRLWPGLAPGEAAYLAFVFVNLLVGFMLILFVLAVIALEKPASVRQFFKIGPIDWRGIGMIALLTVLLNVLETAFLRRLVYEPIRMFIVSLGLWGQPAASVGFTPDPKLAWLNILLLLLILWIEAPEEILFRGYIQNHLQDAIGPGKALFAGAFIWTAWHLFDIAEVARIFVYGLAISLVFRLRQNTTPLAIWHPLGNRLLLLAVILRTLLGVK
jgi:membrane protease YdiL (CAAX protease family)